MNISKVCKTSYCRLFSNTRYAHSAVAQTSTDSEIERLKRQDAKLSKDVTGISVVSVENYSPITHISVLVKAGARYESATNKGITHCLRNNALLSTKKHTAFAITRFVEHHGAKIGVESTKEYMIYSLQCIRDDVDKLIPVLGEITGEQALKPWEISDNNPRMKIDLAIYKQNPEARLMEAVHKAAYRCGLANSIYSPSFMLVKHDENMLADFIKERFSSESVVVSGLGIPHDQLENNVTKWFNLPIEKTSTPGTPNFRGGEVRIEKDFPITRSAIVTEGASLANTKELYGLGILQCILGIGPQAKYSCGESTRIGSAAAKSAKHPFSVSAININYSDSGLFGVYIAAHPSEMREVIKSVVSKMRESTKNISEEDVQNGKHALKTKLFLELESAKDQAVYMAIQSAAFGQLRAPQDIEKLIDSVTLADVSAVASKVMKTKPAMASIGLLHNTPFLDELI